MSNYAPPPPPPPQGTYVPPPGQPAPGQPAPAQKSGCGKIACIGCSILAILGIIACIVLGIVVVGAIKSTDAYKEARQRATTDPRVIELLGSPVEASFFAGGSVHVDNEGGKANIVFPISGPKGRAVVHAQATRGVSGWTYSELTVQQKDKTIDLLH